MSNFQSTSRVSPLARATQLALQLSTQLITIAPFSEAGRTFIFCNLYRCLHILGYVANLKKLKSEKSLVVVPAPALPRASPHALWSHCVWEEAVVLLGPLCHNRKGVFNTRQTTGGFPVKLRRLSQQVLLKQVSIE